MNALMVAWLVGIALGLVAGVAWIVADIRHR